jgi:hypothetical protein
MHKNGVLAALAVMLIIAGSAGATTFTITSGAVFTGGPGMTIDPPPNGPNFGPTPTTMDFVVDLTGAATSFDLTGYGDMTFVYLGSLNWDEAGGCFFGFFGASCGITAGETDGLALTVDFAVDATGPVTIPATSMVGAAIPAYFGWGSATATFPSTDLQIGFGTGGGVLGFQIVGCAGDGAGPCPPPGFSNSINWEFTPLDTEGIWAKVTLTPEPATFWLMGGSLLGVGLLSRRLRRRS